MGSSTFIDRETELAFLENKWAEVKWTEKPVGTNIVDALKEKARQVNWGDSRTTRVYALFSRKGFTKDIHHRAKDEEILLFEGESALINVPTH